MDIKLLKECGIEAIKDSLLHVLDRACLLLFAFAMGMLAYTLMYGTGALFILVLCAMVCVGIVILILIILQVWHLSFFQLS